MSTKTIESGLLLLVVLAIARHIWLAFHVHPYADDFSYAAAGMQTDLLDRLVKEYRQWNGRYISNILVLRGPITLGWNEGLIAYRTVPILLMALTWAGVFALVRSLALTKVTRFHAALSSMFFVLLYINAMPNSSEGFYWYTGAISYQLPNALMLFLMAAWVTAWRKRGSVGGLQLALMALLVPIIVGCTEVHMVLIVLGHFVLLVLWKHIRGGWDRRVLFMTALAVVCAGVMVFAPGNAERGAHFPVRHDLVATLVQSLLQTGRFVGTWLFATALVPFSLLFILWHRYWYADLSSKPALYNIDRWLALALPLALVFLLMVLPYWSTGILGQYRTVNVALFFFLPLWFVALAVWDAQVLSVRWPGVLGAAPAAHWLIVAVGLTLFATGRDALVTSDLLSGRMARYNAAMTEQFSRIQQAVNQGSSAISLDPITEVPQSLSILPLKDDPDHWMNRSTAEYFGNAELMISISDPGLE